MNLLRRIIIIGLLFISTLDTFSVVQNQSSQRRFLTDNWLLKSSVLVPEDGARISTVDYKPKEWFRISMPTTVLNALVKNGIYPDPRYGLNAFKIPDSSDEFNKKNDLAKYSYLPDKLNPWRDPYWYRTEFTVGTIEPGRHLWLNFNCINYRADVWVNGVLIAGKDMMAGMFQRFRFDITTHVRSGRNALAVQIHPVDHPGEPDTQLEVFGPVRHPYKENIRDVTMIMTLGYDCMMTVPDRDMGISQEVFLDWTGPVDIRHPFVVTELPLPDTSLATLAVSAEMVNTNTSSVHGVLYGNIIGTDISFEQPVALGPNESRIVRIDPKPVMRKPRLWWPVNHGRQYLYEMKLDFEAAKETPNLSTERTIRFGVRQVTSEMHSLEGWHGRRVMINGRKIFLRGGYIQTDLLFNWDPQRIEDEIRYFADANMNLILIEEPPNPPDHFFEACDSHGVLFGNCFYDCGWVNKPGSPDDLGLLERCTVDVIKRYRNHPSLIMYMCQNEGFPIPEVYLMWRRHIIELDGSRFWIPSGYITDFIKGEPTIEAEQYAHFRDDLPTGMNDWGWDDYARKSYMWMEPVTYFRWVRENRSWMFKIESGSASLPPISSLAKFLPDLGTRSTRGAPFPLTESWAHHGANNYFKPYDQAIRRLHGKPESVADYCWKAHLVTADQHRSFYEAVNHRMWDITSGFAEWKINSCFPDVQWQNFDYYLKPGISHFFIKRSCEPLHVQMNLIDHAVSIINCLPKAQNGLEVEAKVFDLDARLLWQRTSKLDVPANSYHEAFSISESNLSSNIILSGLTYLSSFVFVKLQLKDANGRPVSNNFYWLRGEGTQDYIALQKLPLVKLNATASVVDAGTEKLVSVKVANPSDHIAFFIQLALTIGKGGEEILPVIWDDNYISLIPGETREFTARIATNNIEGKSPTLEVGGWNIETDYHCTNLDVSKNTVISGESFTVTAIVANTFLDGSRATLFVDDQPADNRWGWARGSKRDEITFTLNLPERGKHKLTVANRSTTVEVK